MYIGTKIDPIWSKQSLSNRFRGHRVTDIYISPANQQKYIVFDDEQVVKVTASEDGSEQVIIAELSLLRRLNASNLVTE